MVGSSGRAPTGAPVQSVVLKAAMEPESRFWRVRFSYLNAEMSKEIFWMVGNARAPAVRARRRLMMADKLHFVCSPGAQYTAYTLRGF